MKTIKFQITLLLVLSAFSFLISQNVKVNSNFVIESDGTFRMDGAATVWDDLMVFPDATSRGNSYPPTWRVFKKNSTDNSQGVYLWFFSSGSEQELYFTAQIPHSYKVGTALYPHVHWTTTSETPTRSNVVWGLEYSVIAIGGTFPYTSTVRATSIINGITNITGAGQHLISGFSSIPGTDLGISTVICCRLFREVNNSGDTFGNEAGLLGFDIHYEKDTEGSRSEFIK